VKIEKATDLLGLFATDKDTGFTGLVKYVSFDVYGRIVAEVENQELLVESKCFDVSRLVVFDNTVSCGKVAIKSETNLSRKGNYWVHDNARLD